MKSKQKLAFSILASALIGAAIGGVVFWKVRGRIADYESGAKSVLICMRTHDLVEPGVSEALDYQIAFFTRHGLERLKSTPKFVPLLCETRLPEDIVDDPQKVAAAANRYTKYSPLSEAEAGGALEIARKRQ
ncbi:MAG: hypothetical protein R3F11_31050 [Verrucomicrobiales bacterium]